MTNNINHLNNQIMDRKESLEYYVNHSNTTLPYSIEVDSGKKGPVIVIVGAIHGNEPVGVKASIEYLEHLKQNKIELQKGKIIFILGNPQAFEKNQRFIGTNLNRAFVNNPKDDCEGQRVLEIRKYLESFKYTEDEKILLDLHSVSVGDFKIGISPNIKGHYQRLHNLVNLENHFTFNYEHLEGSIMQESDKSFSFSYALECGNHKDPEAYNTALYHINVLLEKSQMLKKNQLPQTLYINPFSLNENFKIKHYSAIDIIKPKEGFKWLIRDVTSGSRIEKGETYAVAKNFNYISDDQCVVLMPDRNPHPEDHDAGFLCTLKLVEPKKMEATTGFEPVYKVLQTSA